MNTILFLRQQRIQSQTKHYRKPGSISCVLRRQIVFKEGIHSVGWVAPVGTITSILFLQLPDKVDGCSDSYKSQLGQQDSN